MTHKILALLTVLFAAWLTGCTGSAYDSIDGPGAPSLSVWPENGNTVARNASVFVGVTPSSADVTGFELREVQNGREYIVSVNAKKRTYANDWLFCPTGLLSSWSDYEVWLEVDGEWRYQWSFSTNSGIVGDAGDCYYVEPRSAAVRTLTVGDGFEPVALPPGRPAGI